MPNVYMRVNKNPVVLAPSSSLTIQYRVELSIVCFVYFFHLFVCTNTREVTPLKRTRQKLQVILV